MKLFIVTEQTDDFEIGVFGFTNRNAAEEFVIGNINALTDSQCLTLDAAYNALCESDSIDEVTYDIHEIEVDTN